MHTYDLEALEHRLRKRGWDVTESGCWEIRGASTGRGYVQVRQDGVVVSAHRAAYLVWVGPLEDGAHVRHYVCDNQRCINPEHLRAGTHQDNMDDKVRHSRQVRGEAHYLAKLTDSSAREIVLGRNAGIPIKELAARYDISAALVKKVYQGTLWKHATADIERGAPTNRLSDDVRNQIIELRAGGWSQRKIADFFGITQTSVWRVINNP